MVSLGLLLAALLFSHLVYLAALWGGARLLKSPKAGFRSALVAVLAIDAVGIALAVVSLQLPASATPLVEVARGLLTLVCTLGATVFILRRVFLLKTGAAWAQLGILVVSNLVMLAMLLLGFRPYLTEAFVVPANAMAPTILGWHRDVTCPKCGQTAFLPVMLDRLGQPEPRRYGAMALAVCGTCRTAAVNDAPGRDALPVNGPDRILVNKLAAPRRWDIVAIRSDRDGVVFVRRLVGLPGETVFVDDGAVWVNGSRLPLPAHLKGQIYTTRVLTGSIRFATRERPLVLGPGDCFLLGDFSSMSADSRLSGPDQISRIVGVADLRYWPVGRIALLR